MWTSWGTATPRPKQSRGSFGRCAERLSNPTGSPVLWLLPCAPHRFPNRQEYGGVRVNLTAMLSNARVPLQIDVGFGDAVTPPRAEVATFPPLLDFLAPRVRAYPAASVVAEKL